MQLFQTDPSLNIVDCGKAFLKVLYMTCMESGVCHWNNTFKKKHNKKSIIVANKSYFLILLKDV